MSAQIPYIHRVVDALNIPAVRQAGYEADDLIGTLAHQAEQAGFDVVIVTGDKDMFQLLTPHVRIYDPVKDKWLGRSGMPRTLRRGAGARRRDHGAHGRCDGQYSRREGYR